MSECSTKCSDIFSQYIAYLGESITDPINIAADLCQNAVIPSAVKERAELNTTPASERTAQLLTAVHRTIRGDFRAPNTFYRTIEVLKNHTETRAIANKMKFDYDGESFEDIDQGSVELRPSNQPASTAPPTGGHGYGGVSGDGGGVSGDGGYPSVMTATTQDNSSNSDQSSAQPNGQPLEISLSGFTVTVPPLMAAAMSQWFGNHPHITRMLIGCAVVGVAYYIYKRKLF